MPSLSRLAIAIALTAAACTGSSDAGTSTTAVLEGSGFDVVLTDVSELVKATEPSVVTVTRTQLDFDELGGQTEVPTGTGSGVVVDRRGHVLTNAHVVAGAQDVLVVGFDGEPRRAQVVGTWGADQNSDLALLLLDDTTGLDPIAVGNSRALEVGDPVVAIGNALGLGLSVSARRDRVGDGSPSTHRCVVSGGRFADRRRHQSRKLGGTVAERRRRAGWDQHRGSG